MDSRRGLLLGLLVAALALPAAAQASPAVRCVPAGGPGCSSSHTTIAAAVSAAADGDTIRIAPRSYSESSSTAQRPSFGRAGSGATTIAPASGSALTLLRGGSVRSLRAVGASGFIGSTALRLSPDVDGTFAYSVADVVATGGNGSDITFGFGGAGLSGATGSATGRVVSLTLSGGSFQSGSAGNFTQTEALPLHGRAVSATVSNTSVIGSAGPGGVGLAVGGGATVDATGLTASGYEAVQPGDSKLTVTR